MQRFPRGIRVRDGSIQIRFQYKGAAHCETLQLEATPENILVAETLRRQKILAIKRGLDPRAGYLRPEDAADIKDVFKEVFRQAKRRRPDQYELTPENERQLIRRAGGQCEVTGIAFSCAKQDFSRRPFLPSLDRIDSSKGYSMLNSRLVCVAANLAMNEWGEEVLRRIAVGYLKTVVVKKLETEWTGEP